MTTPESTVTDTPVLPGAGVISSQVPLTAPSITPTPPIASLLNTLRPGRTRVADPHDTAHWQSFGDSVHTKDETHTRFFFQNIKGLTNSTSCEDFNYTLHSLHGLHVDFCGLAETNLPWSQVHHLQDDFRHCLKREYITGNVVFSSPNEQVDPVAPTTSFQSGGSLTMATGSLVPMVVNSKLSHLHDPSGMGRWSGLTLRGKNDHLVSIITAYRVSSSSVSQARMGSSFLREHAHLRHLGDTAPRPRRHILHGIKALIDDLQSKQHSILLMLDANSALSDDTELQELCKACALHDLHYSDPASSTYLYSDRRRIDYMLGCSKVLASAKRQGTLSYHEGPQSDHRSLFADLDLQILLGYKIPPSKFPSPAVRLLKAGNPELVANYVKNMSEYYALHNMSERIDRLYETFSTMPRETVRSKLEAWDSDQGRAMIAAEKSLKKPPSRYAWSPVLRNAGLLRSYWKLRYYDAMHATNYTAKMTRLEDQVKQQDPTFVFPHREDALTPEEIRTHMNVATKQLRRIQNSAEAHRTRSLFDLLALYDSGSSKLSPNEERSRSKLVRNTIRNETTRSKFAHIRQQLRLSKQSGIQHINVPRDAMDSSTTTPYSYLQAPPSDIVWEKVIERADIERQILRYNREGFRAAAASPCGHGIIHDELTFTSLSIEAAEVLTGHIPHTWTISDDRLSAFLPSFTIPESIKGQTPISTTVSEADVAQGFKKWREATTTSPSGRHLGHYKALITDPMLLSCLTKFLHIALNTGIALNRWRNAVNVMIEKDPGVPNVHRLRIIHLFEADYNFLLKLMWGHRLVRRAADLHLLHPCQHGSVPGHSTMDVVMLIQLTTDLCRLSKQNLARFDNDASACFDRIIVALAMLAARRCGMPLNAISTHAEALQFMRYTVKTVHGVSEESYQGTPFEPLFGTVQGSGASPAAWLSFVVLLMFTLDQLVPARMEFSSPLHAHSRLIDAFVDDTSMGLTDSGDLSFSDMVGKLTTIAQHWEKLLYYSGGSLNLKKCSWYVMYWEWIEGRPRLRPIDPLDPEVLLTQGSGTASLPIQRLPLDQASRILGVHLSPDGDFSKHLQVMKAKSDLLATNIRSPKLTASDIRIFHRTIYKPAMKYSLPSVAVDEEMFEPVQAKILASILNGLGVARTIPTAIRYGPTAMGGLDLLDLRTEMGISSLKLFRDSIFSMSETGKMILINLHYSQVESGLGTPLLSDPSIVVSYLTPTWITSIRQFLFQHNLQIDITESTEYPLRHQHDQYVMNADHLSRYQKAECLDINLVRIYLQAMTLSDLSTGNGRNICRFQLAGERPPEFQPRGSWPRQEAPTTKQIRLWKAYISTSFLGYNTTWKTALGKSVDHPPILRNQDMLSTPLDPQDYSYLKAYLKDIPSFYRRLLHHHEQQATDVQVWRAFRDKKSRLEIVTDGSLAESIGTFGWRILRPPNLILFQGSGPVDGPRESGTSTRSELGGFAAPLLLVAAIARFWGIQHRCKFRWIVDSTAAISKVEMVTCHGARPR